MKLHIIGAGGHAKVVIDSLNKKKYSNIYLYDDKYPKINKLGDIKIINKVSAIPINKKDLYFVAIGNNKIRKKIILYLLSRNLKLETIINTSSLISKNSKIMPGTLIGPRAIINSGACIEKGCIINTASIIEHDCYISDFTHVAPGSMLGGGVYLDKMCLIGIGSIIIPNVKVKKNTLVKAGSIIKK